MDRDPARIGMERHSRMEQPASQLGRLVEKHIAGERLAWYFFLVALTALAFETLLLRRWNSLFS